MEAAAVDPAALEEMRGLYLPSPPRSMFQAHPPPNLPRLAVPPPGAAFSSGAEATARAHPVPDPLAAGAAALHPPLYGGGGGGGSSSVSALFAALVGGGGGGGGSSSPGAAATPPGLFVGSTPTGGLRSLMSAGGSWGAAALATRASGFVGTTAAATPTAAAAAAHHPPPAAADNADWWFPAGAPSPRTAAVAAAAARPGCARGPRHPAASSRPALPARRAQHAHPHATRSGGTTLVSLGVAGGGVPPKPAAKAPAGPRSRKRKKAASAAQKAAAAAARAAAAAAPPGPHYKSAYRGVTLHKRSRRYEAHVYVKQLSRQVFCGAWDSEAAAAAAVDIAAVKAHLDRQEGGWAAALGGAAGEGAAVAAVAAVPALNLDPRAYVAALPALRAADLEAQVASLRDLSKVARGLDHGPAVGRVAWPDILARSGVGVGPDGRVAVPGGGGGGGAGGGGAASPRRAVAAHTPNAASAPGPGLPAARPGAKPAASSPL